jgi:hypothetical protein
VCVRSTQPTAHSLLLKSDSQQERGEEGGGGVKARDRYGVVPPPPHTQTLVHVECSLKHSLETHVDAVNAAVLLSRAQAVSASSDGTAVVWGLGAEEVGVQHVLAAGGGGYGRLRRLRGWKERVTL